MFNTKSSASIKQYKNEMVSRSPLKLKDQNVLNESSTGCFSFFLPNHSINKPIFRDFKGKLVKKGKNLTNPDCFTAVKVKSDDVITSRCDLVHGVDKFTTGFQFKVCDFPVNVVKVGKNGERCDFYDGFGEKSCGLLETRFELDDLEVLLGESRDVDANVRKCSSRCESDEREILLGESRNVDANVRQCSSRCDGIDKCEEILLGELRNMDVNERKCSLRCDVSDGIDGFSTVFEDVTAVKKFGSGCGFTSCDDGKSTTSPPVEGLVSSEVRGGLMSGMDAVVSGVTDDRKYRRKGLLASGSKMKCFRNEGEGEGEGGGGVREVNSRRDTIVASPIEASVCCISSPCDEKMSGRQCEESVPFELVGMSSSPSSSLGFSSELFDTSNCTISTSDGSASTPNSRECKSYALHSDLSSEFGGVLGPSRDYLGRCPSSRSAVATRTCNDHERLCIPKSLNFEDRLRRNVMKTPDSNSSRYDIRSSYSPKLSSSSPHFSLSDLSRDQISRLWLQCKLDSVTEIVPRVGLSPECQVVENTLAETFELNPLNKLDNSFNLPLFQKAVDTRSPNNSEARISWREGLANRMFEMDEFDCCRYLSDEGDYSDCCSDISESSSCQKLCPVTPEAPKLCPEESSWTVCYQNSLFQA